MKKFLTLVFCGLLVIALSVGSALAKPGGGSPGGNQSGGSSQSQDKGGKSDSSSSSKGIDNDFKKDGKSGSDNSSTNKGNNTKFGTEDETSSTGTNTKEGSDNANKNGNKTDGSDGVKVTNNKSLDELKGKYKNLGKQKDSAEKLFQDTERHWANNSIKNMAQIGLVNGYGDGTFKPDSPVSNIEVIAMMMRMTAEEGITNEDEVEDGQEGDTEEETSDSDEGETGGINENVDDEDGVDEGVDLEDDEQENGDELSEVPGWAKNAAKKANGMGIININRFHSEEQATRAQAAVYIAKSLGLEPADDSDLPFSDGSLISQEDVGYIMALYEQEYITGMPGGSFNPNSSITRAEISVIMERILADQNEEPGEDEEPVEGEDSTGDETDDEGTLEDVGDQTGEDETNETSDESTTEGQENDDEEAGNDEVDGGSEDEADGDTTEVKP